MLGSTAVLDQPFVDLFEAGPRWAWVSVLARGGISAVTRVGRNAPELGTRRARARGGHRERESRLSCENHHATTEDPMTEWRLSSCCRNEAHGIGAGRDQELVVTVSAAVLELEAAAGPVDHRHAGAEMQFDAVLAAELRRA